MTARLSGDDDGAGELGELTNSAQWMNPGGEIPPPRLEPVSSREGSVRKELKNEQPTHR